MLLKVLIAVLLASPTTQAGLLASFFRIENSCYIDCQSHFTTDKDHDACKKGCDYQLFSMNNNNALNCEQQCKSRYSHDPKVQESCQTGCKTMGDRTVQGAPDSVSLTPDSDGADKPKSIILVRLRQRPLIQVPSIEQIFGSDPFSMFNDIFNQFKQKTAELESAIKTPSDTVPAQTHSDVISDGASSARRDFPAIFRLIQSVPIMPIERLRVPAATNGEKASSESSSSEEHHERGPFNLLKHNRLMKESAGLFHKASETSVRRPLKERVQQFFQDVRHEWNDLVRKQPRIPMWIFVGILLISSAMLWYMVVALCRHTPSSRQAMSIRSQELIFHPYDNVYSTGEKEKIQPDDQLYEVESLPIKVKLSNI